MYKEYNFLFNCLVIIVSCLIIVFIAWFFYVHIFKDNKKSYNYFNLMLKTIVTLFIAFFLTFFIEKVFVFLGLDSNLVKITNILVSIIIAFFLYKLFQKSMEEQVDELIERVESKYSEYQAYAPFYFEHLFGMKNTIEEERILKGVLKNHKELAKNNEYLVSFSTYLDIVIDFLKQGYSLISVNSTLIPYWYAPTKFEDNATLNYIKSLKNFKNHVNRITYCEDKEWWNNSVKKIFDDLADSEKEKKYAIQWLATLYRAIKIEPKDPDVKDFIGLNESNDIPDYSFFIGDNASINTTAKDKERWNKVTTYLDKESERLTTEIRKKYEDEMGIKALWCYTTEFINTFNENKQEEFSILEIGLFQKDDRIPFTILLMGNISQTVKIKIITKQEINKNFKTKIEKLIESKKEKKCNLIQYLFGK